MKFLKQATYIRYVMVKLSKFVQISMLTSSGSFSQRVLWKLKRAWNWFPGLIFHIIFWKKNYFIILHKLAKVHYQTVFTSQVIHQYMLHVSCLGIGWRHDIWISEKLKFDYPKDETSFQSEIKNVFPSFTSALF